MTLFDHIKSVLSENEAFCKEGQLFKNTVVEAGLKLDTQLLKLLLKDDKAKKHFFAEVDGIAVFDKAKFQKFVSNKQFLPDSFTAFKNKIGLTANGEYLTEANEVVLDFPYKDCVLEGGQTKEDQKRNEIFWNETLAPDSIDRLLDAKGFTNFKKYDKDGEHKVTEFKGDENLILKGNNLLVLSSLLKTHRGKVKLIYIDPPFNTENDSFRYNDTFNHSTWLTFVLNRLEIAKELLSDDGLIFIHLDQIEEAYMKIVCDEVFGRENYVNTITVKSSTPSGTKTAHKDKTIIKQKDFILVFRKTNQARFNPQYKRKSNWDSHFNYFLDRDKETVSSFLEILKENSILSQKQSIKDFDVNNKTHRKFYMDNMALICQTQSHKNEELKLKSKKLKDQVLFVNKGEENETMFYNGRQLTPLSKSVHEVIYNGSISKDFGMLLCDFWDDIDFQNTQNEGGVSFTNGKKPEELLYRIINMASNEGDIVLDFFVGSGTTSCVAHKMKRKYIGIEQMDYIQDLPCRRLEKVIEGEQGGVSKSLKWQGGGSFIYSELMEYNQKYIHKIQKTNTKEGVLEVWGEMQEKAFLSYQFDKDVFDERLDAFKTATLETMQKYLIEILDENQLYVNFSEIEDDSFGVSKEDKALNYSFYKANN